MLLIEWARQLGLPIIREHPEGLSLDNILRFVFGERYVIQMKDGRSYEDKNLEAILEVMADEFRVYNTTLLLQQGTADAGLFPKVELLNIGGNIMTDPLGNRKSLSLCVSVVTGRPSSTVLPPPDIEAVVTMVREAVTMYSLVGDWGDNHRKDNL